MINLEQDFIKFETNGEFAYYGYNNNPSSSEDDNSWSIRLLTGTSSEFDVKWSNGSKLNYISKWSDRASYFFVDGSQSISATWSAGVPNYYNNYRLDVSWDDIPGMDKYDIIIKDNDGNVLNKNGHVINNIYTNYIKTDTTNKGSYSFYATKGLTYSFTIKADNAYGNLLETFQFIN